MQAFDIIVQRVKADEINIRNYSEYEEFNLFVSDVISDIKNLPYYTFDGRFEKIIFKAFNELEDNSYDKYINIIEVELKRLIVPTIMLIPLNQLDSTIINSLQLSENIRLFCPKDYNRKQLIKNDALSEYVENTIYAKLNKDHIVKTKDSAFFNHPILTIRIINIDNKVEVESGKIAEAVYSVIRMMDFKEKRSNNGWGIIVRHRIALASTYSVYYNMPETIKKPPYDSGYGYSFRFKFSPILDINTESFISKIKVFNNLIERFIKYCFMDKRNHSEDSITDKIKWQNAVLMFNTAYEFASIEKYDSAVIILHTILESLFLKNTGNKKKLLVEKVPEYLSRNNCVVDINETRKVIENTYSKRNKFVHEGIGYEHNSAYYKPLNAYQGMIRGMKPFAYNGLNFNDNYSSEIMALFDIIINVLMVYST